MVKALLGIDVDNAETAGRTRVEEVKVAKSITVAVRMTRIDASRHERRRRSRAEMEEGFFIRKEQMGWWGCEAGVELR